MRRMSQPIEAPTHVVTCFVLRRGPDGDAVLLVRRSERVRTYRGAWAAVSGYLEPNVTPIEQAYTELREETGLDRTDVVLLRTGEPLAFRDAQLAQSWVVHPFLFSVASSERIRTDWEATEHRWVPPVDVATFPTVPMLAEALARVYPAQEPSSGAH
jgi:8-oxo-dGTP pyrophosphatase MutT (NUDIX family)